MYVFQVSLCSHKVANLIKGSGRSGVTRWWMVGDCWIRVVTPSLILVQKLGVEPTEHISLGHRRSSHSGTFISIFIYIAIMWKIVYYLLLSLIFVE